MKNRTIVVTRATRQSADLEHRLTGMGARVVKLPTISIAPPSDPKPLDHALQHLADFDWVLFTSSNAVDFFIRRARELGVSTTRSESFPTTAAIGPATARAMRSAGLEPDLVAAESRSEGVAQALLNHVGCSKGSKGITGLRVLIPRARVAREILPESLRAAGAVVETVEAYQNVRPRKGAGAALRLIKRGEVDAITFTSSSTVANFVSLLDRKALVRARSVLAACIGPVTAATAMEHEFEQVVHPRTYTTEALIDILVEHLGNRR